MLYWLWSALPLHLFLPDRSPDKWITIVYSNMWRNRSQYRLYSLKEERYVLLFILNSLTPTYYSLDLRKSINICINWISKQLYIQIKASSPPEIISRYTLRCGNVYCVCRKVAQEAIENLSSFTKLPMVKYLFILMKFNFLSFQFCKVN